MKLVAVILVLTGIILFGVGMSMRTKQNAFATIKKGDKVESMAVGATAGAVAGGVGAMSAGLGGIGITACGTGFGIPAGVICLGVAGVCALIGGGIGYATGTPDKTSTILVNAYAPWEYWTVIVAGCLLTSLGVFFFFRATGSPENIDATCN